MLEWSKKYGVEATSIGKLTLRVDYISNDKKYVATCDPLFAHIVIPGAGVNRKDTAVEMVRMALREHMELLQ